MRNLTFKDALKMQKILKKSGIMQDLKDGLSTITEKDSEKLGYAILSLIFETLIEKFDLIEEEFIEFIEDVYNIKNFRDLELDEAFKLIIGLKDNKGFASFFQLFNNQQKQ